MSDDPFTPAELTVAAEELDRQSANDDDRSVAAYILSAVAPLIAARVRADTPEPSTPPAQPPRHFDDGDPAPVPPEDPDEPAQPHGERRAAAGPPPGTLDGPGVLGRALLDANGDPWPLDGRGEAEANPPIREVLLVDPAGGRVLEQLVRLVREHDRYDDRFRAAYAVLAAAVDALDRPTTGADDESAWQVDAGPVRPVDLAAVRHAAGGGFRSKGVDPEPASEPAGDGPGWDRCDIHWLIHQIDSDSRSPEFKGYTANNADNLRALLADRDFQRERRFALNQMLAEAWDQRDAVRDIAEQRFQALERVSADLTAARAELAETRSAGEQVRQQQNIELIETRTEVAHMREALVELDRHGPGRCIIPTKGDFDPGEPDDGPRLMARMEELWRAKGWAPVAEILSSNELARRAREMDRGEGSDE